MIGEDWRMTFVEESEGELSHYGKKGMKWGVRRGSDGVRPIARTLNDSKFGKMSKANADRYNSSSVGKAQARGQVKKHAKAAEKAEARAKAGPPSKTNYYLTGRMGSKDSFTNPAAREQRIAAGKSRTIAAIAAAGTLGLAALGKGGSSPAFVLAGTAAVASSLAQVGAFKAIDLEQKSRANG